MKRDSSPAGKTEQIAVEVMSGPEDGRVVVCEETPISIGRGSDNVVPLPYDHLISRHHAKIVRSEDELTLYDLDSTNGTFVRGKRVRGSAPIEPKKLFRVGGTLLMVRLRSGEE